MKTPEEVEALKRSWLNDPCWDIETTEGFEDHRDELIAFSDAQDKRWAQQARERLAKKAEELGCTGNLKLARYVEGLENRIDQLAQRLEQVTK